MNFSYKCNVKSGVQVEKENSPLQQKVIAFRFKASRPLDMLLPRICVRSIVSRCGEVTIQGAYSPHVKLSVDWSRDVSIPV
jgi:hypothetical protein